ncbi:MAG TPA: Hpt domain-containing protein [Polyangiaceae bacterium]|nr:Hpt domain-containing protein [Polyangiaceae bacterium]
MTESRRLGPGPYTLDPECQLPPRLIEVFLRSAPGQVQLLVDACSARDVEAARAQAHKLKGSLYAAGATRLAEDLEALRQLLATGSWSAAEPQLQGIRREFAAVLAQLQAQLTGGGA